MDPLRVVVGEHNKPSPAVDRVVDRSSPAVDRAVDRSCLCMLVHTSRPPGRPVSAVVSHFLLRLPCLRRLPLSLFFLQLEETLYIVPFSLQVTLCSCFLVFCLLMLQTHSTATKIRRILLTV